jgi:hypothetical protein
LKQKTLQSARAVKPVFTSEMFGRVPRRQKEPNALFDAIQFVALLPICLLLSLPAILADRFSLQHHR